ncbi:MAG: hypothetical protein VYA30_13925 [Myxococcota bacterium]|nr:hypothetical protein [Myxococcota bacterium]
MSRRTGCILLIISSLCSTTTAWSEPARQPLEAAEQQGYTGRPEDLKPGSLLGGSIAVFPGVVFHGLGHIYTEDYGVALSLFAVEILGIGMMTASQVLNSKYGGSSKTAPAEQALSHVGFILFMASWAADVIGSYKGSAPFTILDKRADGTRLGIRYRFAENPLNRFRHHFVLSVSFETHRLSIQPWLDLEASLERRELGIEASMLTVGESRLKNHLSLGIRGARLENHPDGWANQSFMGFIDTRFDLGRWISTLKKFFLFNRIGYGFSGYQFSETAENVPSLLKDIELSDYWLYLESGANLALASNTDFKISLVQDPTGVISPVKLSSAVFDTSANEVLKIEMNHRYEDNAGIEVQVVLGSGFGIWLGLEYAL